MSKELPFVCTCLVTNKPSMHTQTHTHKTFSRDIGSGLHCTPYLWFQWNKRSPPSHHLSSYYTAIVSKHCYSYTVCYRSATHTHTYIDTHALETLLFLFAPLYPLSPYQNITHTPLSFIKTIMSYCINLIHLPKRNTREENHRRIPLLFLALCICIALLCTAHASFNAPSPVNTCFV